VNTQRKNSKGYTKFYQVMCIPVLLYGSKCWTMRRMIHSKITNSRNAIPKICKRDVQDWMEIGMKI
jgi:hypothetical protein